MAHGGKREGAGRKPGSISRLKALSQAEPQIKLIKGSAAHKAVTAAAVLGTVDEAAIWARLLSSDQDKIVLGAMQYLTDRRDGKAQQTIKHGSIDGSASSRAKSVIESAISPTPESTSDSTARPN